MMSGHPELDIINKLEVGLRQCVMDHLLSATLKQLRQSRWHRRTCHETCTTVDAAIRLQAADKQCALIVQCV